MKSWNELLKQAMTWQYPNEIPVSFGMLPAAWIKNGPELARLAREYPDIIPRVPDLDHMDREMPASYHVGSFVDEWGCRWENLEEGMESKEYTRKHRLALAVIQLGLGAVWIVFSMTSFANQAVPMLLASLPFVGAAVVVWWSAQP